MAEIHRWALTILGTAAILVSVVAEASAEARVALVIGNSSYRHAPKLANPANDAGAVAAAFSRLGFAVVEGRDLDRKAFEEALSGFGAQARDADVAVVYYAEHAVQVEGINYLLPVDARLQDDRRLKWETLPLDFALDEMRGAKQLRVVILDACRHNPLAAQMARSSATRSGATRGLAVVEKTEGDTLIAYATRAGAEAADGDGRHSPFTEAFLRHLDEPGVEIRQFFGKVRDTVLASTGGRQEPWVHGSLGGTGFYWRLQGGTASPAPSAVPIAEMDETWVVAKTANLRAEPSASARQVGRLEAGSEVAVSGRTFVSGATWYRVSWSGGAAFVLGSLLSEPADRPEASPDRADPPAEIMRFANLPRTLIPTVRAAESGNREAQAGLGAAYEDGAGLPVDLGLAHYWFRRSADQGWANGEYRLGRLYFHGKGVPVDYGEASALYMKAAGQGHVDAQASLGAMYIDGKGVSPNPDQARKWTERAVKQGSAVAMNNYAYMHTIGFGVPKSPVWAHVWYTLAASSTDDQMVRDHAGSRRDRVAQSLTAGDLKLSATLVSEMRSK